MTKLMGLCEINNLAAPGEDGGTLIYPCLGALPALAEANRGEILRDGTALMGMPRAVLAATARRELLDAALKWTRQYRDAVIPDEIVAGMPRVLATGHQPELFHPGVWFKNAVLSRVAEATGSVAIHLIVDDDILKSTWAKIPAGTPESPEIRMIPFDSGPAGIPYEDRTVNDPEIFTSFGEQVANSVRHLVADPLIAEFWPLVLKQARATRQLGYAICRARHLFEDRWGWNTLEIPQSVVCELPTFRRFMLHLWRNAPRFADVHNQAVREYRRKFRLRSRSHPFPELQIVDGWWETPFWTWTRESPARQRLFIRFDREGWAISDGAGWQETIPSSVVNSFANFQDWCEEVTCQGRRIRSRAVITTLWARWCLSDLFIHGIGGAKYDRVTDAIIRELFGCEPPAFCTATATLHLPVPKPSTEPRDLMLIRQELRDLEFHPEKHIDWNTLDQTQRMTAENWLTRKWEWIRTAATPSRARARFLGIRECNQQLQPFVAWKRRQLESLVQTIEQRLKGKAILTARDWPFCVYRTDQLDRLFTDLLQDPRCSECCGGA